MKDTFILYNDVRVRLRVRVRVRFRVRMRVRVRVRVLGNCQSCIIVHQTLLWLARQRSASSIDASNST